MTPTEQARAALEALVAYGEARQVRIAAQRACSAHRCEEAYRGTNITDDPGEPPCYLGDSQRDWCDPCRERERLYPAYKAARKSELQARRRLHVYLDRTITREAAAHLAPLAQGETLCGAPGTLTAEQRAAFIAKGQPLAQGETPPYRCDDEFGCDWEGTREQLVVESDGVVRCPACSSVAIIEPKTPASTERQEP